MRILHINCNYMTTALHQTMMGNLEKHGVESVVFAPVYDKKLAVITPKENVVVSECFRKWDRLHFDYKQKKIISAAEKSVDVASFNCIHAYTLFTDGNCAMTLSRKYGIPYVVAVRSTDLNDFLRLKPWLRGRAVEIMEHAAKVFFLSQRYLEDMITIHVPKDKQKQIREKSLVVPNGIDDFWLTHVPEQSAFKKTAFKQKKEVNLIVAGRVNKNKNQLTAMKATQLLNEMGYLAHLTVVGPVEDASVEAKLKCSSAVTCIGAQPKEKLIEYYRNSDIFVLPSYKETFGLVYAEAMSQGLPVIYTRGQGFDGQFPEGDVGFSIDPNSSSEIAEKVLLVMDHYDEIAATVSEKARPFNWLDITGEYAQIYKQLFRKGE